MSGTTPGSKGESELERFRAAIGERLGLWMDDAKLPELDVLLARRTAENRMTALDYLALVESPTHGKAERRALAQTLTVGETYFFRQGDQITALLDHVQTRSAPVRVLCAGCSSGEEPYSIAIALREHALQLASTATIRALDINAAALERARIGRYSSWALRETHEAIARRWFQHDGKSHYQLSTEIRGAVQFEERNLVERNADLFAQASYDAVYFRNVLMYFTPQTAAAVIDRIAQALVPGGLLFLGYAETLRGLSNAFHLRHSRETFFYQKRDGAPLRAFASSAPAELPQRVALEAPVDLAWPETIAQSSVRVRELTTTHSAERSWSESSGAASPTAPFDLHPTFELLRKERFGDALDAMQALPTAATQDRDVLLLRAALLVHSGKLDAARETCAVLLALDELNAGAHYLLGLVCEGERELARCVEHHRIAAYLDPSFAMPRLHLGLLARRNGDALGARRELRQAYALLERDDTARLLMFAGGFERAALLALCRSELLASGGTL
jgi:chemotaxis protein methyltransferase CheR